MGLFIKREGTADMGKHGRGVVGQGSELRPQISEQLVEVLPLMVMGDGVAHEAPEPFDAIGIWIIGGRIHQSEAVPGLGEQATHQERPAWGMCPQVVGQDDGDASALPRACDGGAQLLTEEGGGALGADAPVEPALAPIDQAKAVDLPVGAGGLDQALAASPFAAPDARERRVQGDLHLVLEVEISIRKESEQVGHSGGELIPQIRLNEIAKGQRCGRCGARQQHLHPQAFPT